MKIFALLLVGLALLQPARAGCPDGCPGRESPEVSTLWSGDAQAPTRIILATPSHSYGGPIWAALEIDIADGWFVYATKADNAAAPELEWGGSVNLAPTVLRWPPPEIVLLDGNPTPVFRGRVILPISIAPLQADRDIEMKLNLSYAVCGEVCRPAAAAHRIKVYAAPIDVLPEVAARYARLIAEALSRAGGG